MPCDLHVKTKIGLLFSVGALVMLLIVAPPNILNLYFDPRREPRTPPHFFKAGMERWQREVGAPLAHQ